MITEQSARRNVEDTTVELTPEVKTPAATTHGSAHPWFGVAGRALGVITAFGANAAIARLLPAGTFSDFQLLLALLTPLSWVAVLGFNSAAVRLIGKEIAEHGSPAAVQLTWRFFRYAALSALLFVPLLWLALKGAAIYGGFPLPSENQILLMFCVAVALIGMQQVVAECFLGHHDLTAAPLFTGGIMAGPFTTLLFLLLLCGTSYVDAASTQATQFTLAVANFVTLRFQPVGLAHATTMLLVAVAITLPLAQTWLYWRLGRERSEATGSANPHPANLMELLRLSLSMLVLTVTIYFLTVLVDVTIASKMFRDADQKSLVELDWYFAARRLTFMAFITTQLAGSLATPKMAVLHFSQDRVGLQALMRKYAWLGGLPAVIAVAVCLLAPEFLLGWYLGPRFIGAAGTVRILALAPLFAAWTGCAGYALAVTGYQNRMTVVSVLAALFVIVAGVPAAYYGGINALALVSVAALSFKHGVEWYLARRVLGVWSHMY